MKYFEVPPKSRENNYLKKNRNKPPLCLIEFMSAVRMLLVYPHLECGFILDENVSRDGRQNSLPQGEQNSLIQLARDQDVRPQTKL